MAKKEWKQGASAKIQYQGSYPCYTLELRLTEGQKLMLRRILKEEADRGNTIADDVACFINNALHEAALK